MKGSGFPNAEQIEVSRLMKMQSVADCTDRPLGARCTLRSLLEQTFTLLLVDCCSTWKPDKSFDGSSVGVILITLRGRRELELFQIFKRQMTSLHVDSAILT